MTEHVQNRDPFFEFVTRPSGQTRLRMNRAGLTNPQRAELAKQWQAEIAAEEGAAKPAPSKVDQVAALEAERARALAFVEKIDGALAAHGPRPSAAEVAAALEDEDEVYGEDDD
jgi:hypothetical protein